MSVRPCQTPSAPPPGLLVVILVATPYQVSLERRGLFNEIIVEMKLKKIYLLAFRNLKKIELAPAHRFNIFYGKNAQGKTSLLESIFLLGTLKSFKLAKNSELITWGSEMGLVKGWVERDGVTREIAIQIEKLGKKVKLDQKSVVKADEFFGNLNVVVFTPEEITMVRGVPDLRRKYLDRAVFSSDVTYLSVYHDYCKILKNRNILLRSGEKSGLDIWTEKLAETGSRVITRRLAYLRAIEGLLNNYYSDISGTEEVAEIAYRPHLLDSDRYEQDSYGALGEALARSSMEEQRRGTTLAGPHRDDIDFVLNGRSLKLYGSQGQQRSFILALKMAEIEYLHRKFDSPPILLLDDMTSELDQDRKRNLMEFLKRKEMQVFITTTSLQNISLEGIENYRTFHVSEGMVHH